VDAVLTDIVIDYLRSRSTRNILAASSISGFWTKNRYERIFNSSYLISTRYETYFGSVRIPIFPVMLPKVKDVSLPFVSGNSSGMSIFSAFSLYQKVRGSLRRKLITLRTALSTVPLPMGRFNAFISGSTPRTRSNSSGKTEQASEISKQMTRKTAKPASGNTGAREAVLWKRTDSPADMMSNHPTAPYTKPFTPILSDLKDCGC